MARINDTKKYPKKTNVKKEDYIIGTQASTGKTINISVEEIIKLAPSEGDNGSIKEITFRGEKLEKVNKTVVLPSKLSQFENDIDPSGEGGKIDNISFKGEDLPVVDKRVELPSDLSQFSDNNKIIPDTSTFVDETQVQNKIEDWSIKNIETIAKLKQEVGKEGQKVRLLGYYSAGDKPELLYEWKTGLGEDDGGSVINSTGGRWEALFNQEIDVRHFGAKENDEYFDNSVIFNKAIDIRLGIIIPLGKWYVSNPIYPKGENITGISALKTEIIPTRDISVFIYKSGVLSSRNITMLSDFSIQNRSNIILADYVIKMEVASSDNKLRFNSGLLIQNIEIGGAGRYIEKGIQLSSCIRVKINNVGMTDVGDSLLLLGKCVQVEVDFLNTNTKTQYNGQKDIGVLINSYNYQDLMYGGSETIRITNSGFVGHYICMRVTGGEHVNISVDGTDFDYFKKYGLQTNTSIVINNNYFGASSLEENLSFIKMDITSTTADNNLVISNNTIVAYNKLHPTSTGIIIGDNNLPNYLFVKGANIYNNFFKGVSKSIGTGISIDRNINTVIDRNIITNDIIVNNSILATNVKSVIITNNICKKGIIKITAPIKNESNGIVTGNECIIDKSNIEDIEKWNISYNW